MGLTLLIFGLLQIPSNATSHYEVNAVFMLSILQIPSFGGPLTDVLSAKHKTSTNKQWMRCGSSFHNSGSFFLCYCDLEQVTETSALHFLNLGNWKTSYLPLRGAL